MAQTGRQPSGDNRSAWPPAAAVVLAVIGAICAVGFFFSISSRTPTSEEGILDLVRGSSRATSWGLVASLAVPVAASVVLLRTRVWWVLIAATIAALLSAVSVGVS